MRKVVRPPIAIPVQARGVRLGVAEATNREDIMRAAFAGLVIAAIIGLAGPAGASTPLTKATPANNVSMPANATVVAAQCRCVERRWNGSCKLRVCRDRW
jgi:hypothetical protein